MPKLNMSVDELVDISQTLHHLKPNMVDQVVVSVEESKPEDKNLIFETVSVGDPLGERRTVVLSLEYIQEKLKELKKTVDTYTKT